MRCIPVLTTAPLGKSTGKIFHSSMMFNIGIIHSHLCTNNGLGTDQIRKVGDVPVTNHSLMLKVIYPVLEGTISCSVSPFFLTLSSRWMVGISIILGSSLIGLNRMARGPVIWSSRTLMVLHPRLMSMHGSPKVHGLGPHWSIQTVHPCQV